MPSLWQQFKIRVRYQETDQMGVVYHTNYLNWFEWGRTEWIRTFGLSYKQFEEAGLLLPVIEASIKYHAAAAYDQELIIRTRVESVQPMTIKFNSEIVDAMNLDQKIASGWTEHVWMNTSKKVLRLDRNSPDWYELLKSTIVNANE